MGPHDDRASVQQAADAAAAAAYFQAAWSPIAIRQAKLCLEVLGMGEVLRLATIQAFLAGMAAGKQEEW